MFWTCSWCVHSPLCADPLELLGRRVTDVQFEPAQQPLTPADLNPKIASVKKGEPLLAADIRAAIQQLYASGRYENITVDAQPAPDGGVIVKFVTSNALFVRDVQVNGVPEPPNKGQLVNATKLDLGTRFSEPQVRQAQDNLLDVLRLNGLYKAEVHNQREIDPPTQQIDLSFGVNAGKRAKFDTPIIKGKPERTEQQIIRASGWRKFLGFGGWREVSEARVQSGLDGIRKSYQKKDFLMARATLEQMDYNEQKNRVVPILNVDAGPLVEVQVRGAKVSKGKLRQLLPIYQEQSVDKDLLVEGKRNLTEFFESKGYFDAEVDFDLSKDSDGDQVIEYAIARGDSHKLVLVEITGNHYFDLPTLRERMYLATATPVRFPHGRYSTAYLRRDIAAITDLYQANGFRDVEVKYSIEDDYKGKAKALAVFITINEGPQWLVGNLELVGVPDSGRDDILGMIHSSEGQPFSDLNVVIDQETILNYYFNLGYPNATFDASEAPLAAQHRMNLKFTVKPGVPHFVREVLISGLAASNPQLVNSRIRDLDPGAPLSQEAITESQRRLYDLGIFARVDAALQNPDGDEAYKYVLYRFEEGHKYSLTGGIGAQVGRIGSGSVTAFDAPGGTTGFSPRVSFGINRLNFLGLGHTVGLQTRYSNVDRRALFSYQAPQFKGNDRLSLSFTGLYDDSRDVRTFNARREEATAQLSQRLTKANTIQYRLGYRRVTVDQNSLKITPQLIPLLSQPVQLGIASMTFIQDRRDDAGDPHKGIYNTLDGAFASNFFGSKTSFTRALGRNATYHHIKLGREVILARETSFGVISRLGSQAVPLPERFFAGGATSHRGFAENQAGPRDPETGFPLGGQALLMNIVELRFPLLGENVGGVVFHDAGNVYSGISKLSFRSSQKNLTDFDYMVHAVGFGIRYRTPVGPIRVDLGYAINPPRFIGFKGTQEQLFVPVIDPALRVQQQLSHFQFHFSLGQAF